MLLLCGGKKNVSSCVQGHKLLDCCNHLMFYRLAVGRQQQGCWEDGQKVNRRRARGKYGNERKKEEQGKRHVSRWLLWQNTKKSVI